MLPCGSAIVGGFGKLARNGDVGRCSVTHITSFPRRGGNLSLNRPQRTARVEVRAESSRGHWGGEVLHECRHLVYA
jgi:hypothetical protein